MMPMWWGGGGWGYGWGVVGMVFMLLFWVLVIAGLVLGVRWLLVTAPGGQRRKEGETAVEILKERYARGEINKEEFEAKRRDLLLTMLL